MNSRPMNRCPVCGQEWLSMHVCPKQPTKDGRALDEWLANTKVVSAGVMPPDGWPKLTKPARVGNGTFRPGVSARLVVEAAHRQHEYAQEEGAMTWEQARTAERNRRKAWDMLNGALEPEPPQAAPRLANSEPGQTASGSHRSAGSDEQATVKESLTDEQTQGGAQGKGDT